MRITPARPADSRLRDTTAGQGVPGNWLLDSGDEGERGVESEGNGLAGGKIAEQDGGIAPLEVPTVVDGEQSVLTGEEGRHEEGAVGIALVAVIQGGAVTGILGNEQKHNAGERLAVLEGVAGKRAFGFGSVNDQRDRLASGNFDGAARDGSARGFDGTDAEVALREEFHFVRTCGQL